MKSMKFNKGDLFEVADDPMHHGEILDVRRHQHQPSGYEYEILWSGRINSASYDVDECDAIWRLRTTALGAAPAVQPLNARFKPGELVADGPYHGEIKKVIKVTSYGCGYDYEVQWAHRGTTDYYDVQAADQHWTLVASPIIGSGPVMKASGREQVRLRLIGDWTVEPNRTGCAHDMVSYFGLNEQFKYCTKCDAKEDIT